MQVSGKPYKSFTEFPICITPLLPGTHIMVSVLFMSPGNLLEAAGQVEVIFNIHIHWDN